MLVELQIAMAVLIFVICGMTTSSHCMYLILVKVPLLILLVCLSLLGQSRDISVTVQDVYDAIRCQKKAKSVRTNGLVMESFMFAFTELWVHLSLFLQFVLSTVFYPLSLWKALLLLLSKTKVLI